MVIEKRWVDVMNKVGGGVTEKCKGNFGFRHGYWRVAYFLFFVFFMFSIISQGTGGRHVYLCIHWGYLFGIIYGDLVGGAGRKELDLSLCVRLVSA